MLKSLFDWLFKRSTAQSTAAAPYKVEPPAATDTKAKKPAVRAKKPIVANKTTKKKS